MKDTLREMRSSGEVTTHQVWSAIDNMNWMARSMHESLQKLSAQTSDTHDLAVAAGKQADATSRALSLERPWVSAYQTREGFNHEQQVIAVDWKCQNGGRSPATGVNVALDLMIGDAPSHPYQMEFPRNPKCGKRMMIGGSLMLPGGEMMYTIDAADAVIYQIGAVYSKTVGLYLVGCVDYSDSSRKPWYRSNVTQVFIPEIGPDGRRTGHFIFTPRGNDAR